MTIVTQIENSIINKELQDEYRADLKRMRLWMQEERDGLMEKYKGSKDNSGTQCTGDRLPVSRETKE